MQKKHCCLAIGIILIGYYYLVRKKKNSSKKNRENSLETSTSSNERVDIVKENNKEIRNDISIKADVNNISERKNECSSTKSNESLDQLNQKSIELLTQSLNKLTNSKESEVDTPDKSDKLENCDNTSFNNQTHVTQLNIILETPKLNTSVSEHDISEYPVIENKIVENEASRIDEKSNSVIEEDEIKTEETIEVVEECVNKDIDNSIIAEMKDLNVENIDKRELKVEIDNTDSTQNTPESNVKSMVEQPIVSDEVINKSHTDIGVNSNESQVEQSASECIIAENGQDEARDDLKTDAPKSVVDSELSSTLKTDILIPEVACEISSTMNGCDVEVDKDKAKPAQEITMLSNSLQDSAASNLNTDTNNTLNNASKELNIDVLSNSSKETQLDTISDDSGQVSDFANHMTLSEPNSPDTSLSPKSTNDHQQQQQQHNNQSEVVEQTTQHTQEAYISLAKKGSHPTDQPGHFEYEFDFPSRICGRLIGKVGKNINMLKDESGVEITIKRKPFCNDFQVICIQGAISQIDVALDMIKERFPPLKYPEINYSPIDRDDIESMQKMIRLPLEEGLATEVWVSSVISPNHVFVQQPRQSSFKLLQQQDKDMIECYSMSSAFLFSDSCVPMLPRPIEVGTVCAAPMYNGWYRALIIGFDENTYLCDIQFLDYGGFKSVHANQLRQIRSDFTALPFQATECFLSNIAPIEDEFKDEDITVMRNMVFQRSVKAEVVYKEDGIPYCNLYICQPNQDALYLNQELVDRGAAQWIDI